MQLAIIFLALPNYADAQGLANNAKQKAFECFGDMASARLRLPKRYCAIVRLQTTAVTESGTVAVDEIVICADSPRAFESYWCHGTRRGPLEELSSERTVWKQLLKRNGKRFQRVGNTGRQGWTERREEEPGLVDESESTFERAHEKFDPFFLPIAMHVDRMLGKIKPHYPEMLLSHIEQRHGQWTDAKKLVGVWQFGEFTLHYTFDPKENFLPVRLACREKEKDQLSQAPGRLRFAQEIAWGTLFTNDGKEIHVPTEFRQIRFEDQEMPDETRGRIEWFDNSDNRFLPDPDSKDWREKIREAAEEDWDLTFDDFLRKRGKR